ncbi:hypothetical protein INS90_04760 [Trueperella pecoris]|uniref:Oxaloacetate decarboxylase, gamma chain n=1 Tax=Trueperella pecoris TaxID=2733571 RepID=A0A7M1R2Q5_9ACTO|nr:hypothetical protein [Trueperella pecoris]QOR48570.1 hypothetical protein INS90_04760 [Trueperella pecoris]
MIAQTSSFVLPAAGANSAPLLIIPVLALVVALIVAGFFIRFLVVATKYYKDRMTSPHAPEATQRTDTAR